MTKSQKPYQPCLGWTSSTHVNPCMESAACILEKPSSGLDAIWLCEPGDALKLGNPAEQWQTDTLDRDRSQRGAALCGCWMYICGKLVEWWRGYQKVLPWCAVTSLSARRGVVDQTVALVQKNPPKKVLLWTETNSATGFWYRQRTIGSLW